MSLSPFGDREKSKLTRELTLSWGAGELPRWKPWLCPPHSHLDYMRYSTTFPMSRNPRGQDLFLLLQECSSTWEDPRVEKGKPAEKAQHTNFTSLLTRISTLALAHAARITCKDPARSEWKMQERSGGEEQE